MRKHIRRSRLDSYDARSIELPQFPQIERFIVEPLQTIYINLSAAPDANVIRVVRNLNDPFMAVLATRNLIIR